MANEIWNDLYDPDEVDKKRIVRESVEKRSARKCEFHFLQYLHHLPYSSQKVVMLRVELHSNLPLITQGKVNIM